MLPVKQNKQLNKLINLMTDMIKIKDKHYENRIKEHFKQFFRVLQN